MLASAASLLFAVGLGIKEGWPLVDGRVLQTAKGELRQITLADGSLIELNSDTELAVHYSWLGRSLELVRGEALFSVAPGKWRPFEVSAGGGKLRDIGTRFDVAIGLRQTGFRCWKARLILVYRRQASNAKPGPGR
jgi:FecR protein.